MPPDAWLLGRGWDQNDWPGKSFPTAADLDAAFPSRPVWLERIDGHAGWANTAALRRVQRDLAGDWQPEGGRIVRAGDRPTGVFIDAATSLVDAVVPPPDEAFRAEALQRALVATASVGLTGVHDMGTSAADLDLFSRFAAADRLTMRVVAYADGDAAALERLCSAGPYRDPTGRVRMAGVKFYADGALGSRGAALLEPYSDDRGNRGILVTPPEKLVDGLKKARRCGLQVATHAIGDRGNRMVLEDYALDTRRLGPRRSSLARRACAGRVAGRHPDVRGTARRGLHAADARDLRHALGRGASRPCATRRRLRMAPVPAVARAPRAGLGLSSRVGGPATRPLRRGDPPGPGRLPAGRLAAGPEAHSARGAAAASRRAPPGRPSWSTRSGA